MRASGTRLPSHLRRGQRTRERVLLRAVPIATEEGLEALTIGRVAEITGITKAGLLGHYGSKERLQVATLDAGRDVFVASVVRPAMETPTGIIRVITLLDRWVDYVVESRGGCFFTSVAAEFDGRKGLVKDHIVEMLRAWVSLLEAQLEEAVRQKHLAPDTDLSDLSFRLHGYQLSLNLRYQLLADTKVVAQTRRAMRAALLAHATPSGRQLLTAAPKRGRADKRRKTKR